jgi:hypothetical protein
MNQLTPKQKAFLETLPEKDRVVLEPIIRQPRKRISDEERMAALKAAYDKVPHAKLRL